MIHESSYVDEGAVVGEGTRVWHFTHIRSGARIGRNCNLGQNVYVDPGVVIGDRVKIQNNVSVYVGVTVEDDCFLGPSCVFTNVKRPRSAFPTSEDHYPTTVVRQGATIGANATIICGVQIGRWSLVGAGAVVTHDVADYAMVIGVPARRVAWICRCGEKIASTTCDACQRQYRAVNGGIEEA